LSAMISQLVQYAVDRLSFVELTPKSSTISRRQAVVKIDSLDDPTTVWTCADTSPGLTIGSTRPMVRVVQPMRQKARDRPTMMVKLRSRIIFVLNFA
jgi:hypothetical protein